MVRISRAPIPPLLSPLVTALPHRLPAYSFFPLPPPVAPYWPAPSFNWPTVPPYVKQAYMDDVVASSAPAIHTHTHSKAIGLVLGSANSFWANVCFLRRPNGIPVPISPPTKRRSTSRTISAIRGPSPSQRDTVGPATSSGYDRSRRLCRSRRSMISSRRRRRTSHAITRSSPFSRAATQGWSG